MDYYDMKNATNPVGKGSANTTYASFKNRPYASGIVYWPFDTSIIPAEATIDSVACMAKGRCNSSTKGSMQLYSGTVAKGSATSTKTSADVYNLSCGTWTRAELYNIRLLTKITNTDSVSLIFYFYGADLTVTYTYQSEKFMLKLGGSWDGASRVFKKVSGIWVEQTELSGVVEDGVRYQFGGEYVSPNKTVTITGSGNSSYAYVTINGTKYISPATVSVPNGTVMTCSVSDQYVNDPYCYISVDGVKVLENAIGSYNHTVTTSCAVTLAVTQSNGVSYGYITITTQ